MAGLIGSLHTAYTGMSVNQTAIQTTNHNITNINIPGYSRQTASQVARRPHSHPGINSPAGAGQLGQGVQVSQITRARNTFYDAQYRAEAHNYGRTAVRYEYYTSIENIFNEPSDTAISSSLNGFFNSLNELSKDPQNLSAKNVLVEKAGYLCNSLNQATNKLDNLALNLTQKQEATINEVNKILKSIEELDTKIKILEGTGKQPNDLLDQRDMLLDELSFKFNLSNEAVKNAIADGEFRMDELPMAIDISGELEGTREMLDEISKQKETIATIINTLANAVNDVYKNHPDAPDTKDFFIVAVDAKGTTKISVNRDFLDDPSTIQMTADKALDLSKIKDTKYKIDGNDITINTFYNSKIEKLGYKVQSVTTDESNQSLYLLSIDNSRASVSGVSLDEEMINLIQFQHAYNASAKVVSTIDSLLDVVVNGLIR